MTSEKKKQDGFDPVRTILMTPAEGGVKTGVSLLLVLLFLAYLLFGMGYVETPIVALIGAVCAAILIFGTVFQMKDEPVIVLLCAAGIFCLGIAAHLSLLDVNPGRMSKLLSPLMQEMWNYDLLTAMAWEDKAWSGGYLMVLGLLSRLETFPWLYAVKLLNLVFTCIGALAVQQLYRYNGGKMLGSVLASGASLMAVTILLNSGSWAHCDAVFAAFSLWGLYFLLNRHPWPGCLLWGLAVGFKLQAAFLFPLLLPMFMERKIALRHLLALAGGFLLLHIPMFLDGQTLMSVLGRYNEQIRETAYGGAGLTDNAPGIYGLMVVASVREFSGMGLFFGLFMATLLSVAMVRRGPLSPEQWIKCALLLAFGLPLVLPQMNVRMLYLALLIALVSAKDVRGIVLACLTEMISLIGYMKGIFGNDVIPLLVTSLIALVAAVYMITDYLSVQKGTVYAES